MVPTSTLKRIHQSPRWWWSQLILQDLLVFYSSLAGPAEKHLRGLMLPPPPVTWRWCVSRDVKRLVFSKETPEAHSLLPLLLSLPVTTRNTTAAYAHFESGQ